MSAMRLPIPFAGRCLAFAGLPVAVDTLRARLDPRMWLR